MLVIIGPSACGKTQIVNSLINNFNYKKLVTYTTRKMRLNEVDGKDYHFISNEKFEELKKQGFFLEYVLYNQNYYGTSLSDLAKDKVVIIEASGLKAYIEKARDKITIVFIKCSKPIRRIRMIERGDKPDDVLRRLESDDEIFNKEIEQLADAVVDSSLSNKYDCAKLINSIYLNRINNEL